jgi:hypothetical protein
LNETLAGYFGKLVIILINRKPKEMMQFLFSKDEIFENLLYHVYNKSVAEILQKFLAMESSKFDEKNEKFLETKIKAIDNFVDNFETF